MSTSSNAPTALRPRAERFSILRGAAATGVTSARIDADLRENPYADGEYADARLVDPLLAAAFERAVAQAREQARGEGFAQGYADGMELAGREKNSEIDYQLEQARLAEVARSETAREALSVLHSAAAACAEHRAEALHDVEDLILNAALDLATTLLGRELEMTASPARDAVRRALRVLPADVPVTLSLHPIDVAALANVEDLADGHALRIVPDADVEPGSCVVDGGATHINASLSAAIDRVRQVLAT